MKRILSLTIALALVMSLIPATFAAGTSLAKKTITFDKETIQRTKVAEDAKHCVFPDTSSNYYKYTWIADETDTYFAPVENPIRVRFDGSANVTDIDGDGVKEYNGIRLNSVLNDTTNNTEMTIKTKAPKAGRATYKISYVWGHSYYPNKLTSSFNGTSLGALSTSRTGISISAANPFTLETKAFDTLVYTEPDANGYLTIELTSEKNVDILLYQIIIEEVETEQVTFDLSAAAAEKVACADQTAAGENKYFSKISGYIKYNDGDDLIIHSDSGATVSSFGEWSIYDGETKLGNVIRFSVRNGSSVKNLYMKAKIPEGIWQLDVTTGKHPYCGRVRVYIEDKYVGEINDLDSSSAVSSKANVNETSLAPVKVTPDSNGYVTIRFAHLQESATAGYLDFLPFKLEFNNASAAAAYRDVESVSVYADVLGEGGTITSDQITAGIPENPEVGSPIALKAVPDDGYKFAYWSDSAGRVVHYDAEYSFNAYTNKVVYANFDKTDDTSKTGVEFFDGNHDFLGFVENDGDDVTFADYKAKAPTPGMTGYTFVGWSVEDDAEINGVVRAVAQYEDDGIVVGNIAIDGADTVVGAKYGQLIDVNVNGKRNSWQWLRDSKMVGYGENFSFYAFAPATITYSTAQMGEQSPLVVIDALGNDAYMLEYTEGVGEILEAGIVFGTDAKKSVNACYYKATVKDLKEGHGQFTAKKSTGDASLQTVVRGYIIYRFGDDICVKYAELD